MTLLAIVDPLGAIPFFIGFTDGENRSSLLRTALITSITVAAVLIVSALVGERLLQLFGISIASFRVAGGLLLLLMGINMLQGKFHFNVNHPIGADELQDRQGAAVVPLAIPLLSGPGAISSMTIFAHRSQSWAHTTALVVISLLVALITGLTLSLALPIGRSLRKTGLNIAIRLMGLLLSAASVQFISDGLVQLFPRLITP